MANSFAGTFGVIKEPVRKTDKLVVVRLVDRSYKGEPLYFDGEIYDKTAEIAERYLVPGKTAFFSGELYNHQYNGKDYLRYKVNKMEFLPIGGSAKDPKKEGGDGEKELTLSVEGDKDGSDIPF